MKFQPPAQAPAHQSLISACAGAGFEPELLRRLLWLINAHPLLVAHAQVFEHIGALLESAQSVAGIFRHEALLDEAPKWVELCHWISAQRAELGQQPELALLDRKPQHDQDHPLLRQGVSRHAVVAALWNRHHSTPTYPPDERATTAQAYFHLQMQTLVAYMHSRLTYGQKHAQYRGLEHYEQYEGSHEWPIAPSPTSDVGLAIRELSLASHDAILRLLPAAQPAEDYAHAIAHLNVSKLNLPDSKPDHVARYLASLRRYFSRYAHLLLSGIAYRYRRRARSTDRYNSGGRQRRPGYVNLPDVPGVFLKDRPTDEEDHSDLLDTTTVFIDIGLGDEEETGTLEISGLSPSESLEPTLELYAAHELGSKLVALRRQQLALEMQAQQLPFSYALPTPVELRTLHPLLLRCIHRHLTGEQPNRTQSRLECIGALLLLAMLALGQPLARVRELRFALIESPQPVADTEHTTLVLIPQPGDPDSVSPSGTRGFWIPAIGPNYKTDLPVTLSEMQHPPLAKGFMLPDVLGVGALIARFVATEKRPNNRVFGVEPTTAHGLVLRLLAQTGLDRLTPTRIARVLPALIRGFGTDATVSWILSAETDRADEPRMFYTQHRIDSLIRTYRRASHRLARQLGIAAASDAVSSASRRATDEASSAVGARFVAPLEVVRELISTLTNEIQTSRRTPLVGAPLVDYHASYTLFTWVYQALSTSIRAVTSPRANALFLAIPGNDVVAFDAALSDKDDERGSRARLALVDAALSLQLLSYKDHVSNLLQRLQPQVDCSGAGAWQPLLVLDERRRLVPLKPTWVAEQLAHRGLPLPANFHRAFLRTQLLARGVAGEVIDAFLGHANEGEAPFGRFSSFDYGLHRAALLPALRSLHKDLGLTPLKSRLLHYLDRRS